MSMAQATLHLTFPDAAAAATSAASLAPDNGTHLSVRTENAALVLEAKADSPMGLLRTLDDALACLRATGIP